MNDLLSEPVFWQAAGIVLVLTAAFLIVRADKARRRREERLRREEESRQGEDLRRRYAAERAELALRYGKPDRTIAIRPNDTATEVRVYAGARLVSLAGRTYSFTDILSYHVEDRTRTVREDDRMATRGHTRRVLFTPITRKRHISTTSVIRHGKEETLHDYTVRVTINDITSPLVEIHTGADANLTGEVTSTLDVIIRSNVD